MLWVKDCKKSDQGDRMLEEMHDASEYMKELDNFVPLFTKANWSNDVEESEIAEITQMRH